MDYNLPGNLPGAVAPGSGQESSSSRRPRGKNSSRHSTLLSAQSSLRVLGASKRQAFPSPGLFVLRPFCPRAFLSTGLFVLDSMKSIHSEGVPFWGHNPPDIHFVYPVRRKNTFAEFNSTIIFEIRAKRVKLKQFWMPDNHGGPGFFEILRRDVKPINFATKPTTRSM